MLRYYTVTRILGLALEDGILVVTEYDFGLYY